MVAMHQKETKTSEGGTHHIEEEDKPSWGVKEVYSYKYVEVMFPDQKSYEKDSMPPWKRE